MTYLDDRLAVAGKVAVIFGGGGGLGRACALDLGRAGMRLVLVDRDADLLADAVDALTADGVDVVSDVSDARDPEEQARCFGLADERFGGLDVLVNVVGGTFPQPFEESIPKGWDALIRTNFTWLLGATQLAIPRMRARGGGSIVNLTSIEAHRAAPNHAVYSAMKAAVTNLGRSLAVELGPDNIRVNTIAPDFVPTEGLVGLAPDVDPGLAAATDSIAIPLARRGDYGDIGGCALFLASDLSRYVTGTSLHPDGGALASSGWANWPAEGWRNSPPASVVEPLR